MRYGKINKTDIANGPGVRVSLFVSGCRNHCKGCFNPETWAFDYGEAFTLRTVDEILKALDKPYISGLSILGGEPFEPENVCSVFDLCRQVKSRFPDKTIWIYTGYLYEKLEPILNDTIDVLVDGPFIEAQKDITLKFKGSKNQRIIDVRASRSSESVQILY